MSREDIIRMAREAKIEFDHDGSNSFVFSIDQFERFASLVAAAKQEECARVVEGATASTRFQAIEHYKFARAVATAIRALK